MKKIIPLFSHIHIIISKLRAKVATVLPLFLLMIMASQAFAQVTVPIRYRTELNGVRWGAQDDYCASFFGTTICIPLLDLVEPVWKVTTTDNTDGGFYYGMTNYTYYSAACSKSGGYIRPGVGSGTLLPIGAVQRSPGNGVFLLPAPVRTKTSNLATTISFNGQFWEEDCGEIDIITNTGGTFSQYGESGNCVKVFGICTGAYLCETGLTDDDDGASGALLSNYTFRKDLSPCLENILPNDATTTSDFYNQGKFGAQMLLWWRFDEKPVVTVNSSSTPLNFSKCINDAAVQLTAASNTDAVANGAREVAWRYQWQISNSTECDGSNWQNINGAIGKNYTVPEIAGTRLYRCIATPLCIAAADIDPADPLTGISPCVRVTYNPMNNQNGPISVPLPTRNGDGPPPIQSGICGASILPGSAHTLNTLQPPAAGAVVGLTGYSWSATGGTLSAFSGPSVIWTAPLTPGSYSISVTYIDACSQTNVSTTCTTTVDNASCGFAYVDFATGTNNVSSGSAFTPYKTVGYAVAQVGGGTHIRVAGGTYTEPNIIVMQDDVFLEGGYINSGGSWTKSSGVTTTLFCSGSESVSSDTVCHTIGVKASGVTGWTLQDLNIQTGNATGTDGNNRGCSNYGMWLKDCSFYNIVRVNISSGNGAKGGNGGAGAPGANGTPGQQGATQSDCNSSASTSGGAGGGGGVTSWSSGGGGGRGGNTCGNGCGGSGVIGSNGTGGAIGGSPGTGYSFSKQVTSCDRYNGANASGGGGYTTTVAATAGANGGTASPSYSYGIYFKPSGQGGQGGAGYAGAGGGGGAASTGENSSICNSNSGNGGNGGGGGGSGGQGGFGGSGGGGSFSMWRLNSEIGANFIDMAINAPGTAGIGGFGGLGGNGGLGGGQGGGGGSQPAQQGNCDDNRAYGGQGGAGGNGARGGTGQNGSAGVNAALYKDGTTYPTSGSVPSTGTVTVAYGTKKLCINSVINLTKSAGNWGTWPGSFDPVNNLDENNTSYNATTSSPLQMYSNAPGTYDLIANGTTYKNWLRISTIPGEQRPVPSVNVEGVSLPSFATICADGTAALNNTSTFGTETNFLWEIYGPGAATWPQATGTPLFTYSSKNVATAGPFDTEGYYLIKFQVEERCCGWSIPVYAKLQVTPAPTAPTTMGKIPNNDVCDGKVLTVNAASGSTGGAGTCVYEYRYSTDNGANWTLWDATIPSFAAVEGTNLVETRRNCSASGCPISPSFQQSWTVEPQPVAGEVRRDPVVSPYAEVCQNATLDVYIDGALGGVAPVTEEIEYKIGAGGSWTAFTGSISPPLAAVGSEYYFRTRRTSSAANSGCNASAWSTEVLLFTVVNPPTSPTIAKSPNTAVECVGAVLTIIPTTVGNGPITACRDIYRYSTNNGGTWSAWDTLVPVLTTTVAGIHLIEAKRSCESQVNCADGTVQQVAWTVQPGYTLTSSGLNLTVCKGGTATVINGGIAPAPTVPPDVYGWEYSADGSTGWAAVVNGTPAGISYANANTGTMSVIGNGTEAAGNKYYRRGLTPFGGACTSYSPVVTVTTIEDPVITFANTNITLCVGGSAALAATITGGVVGATYIYKWEYSANGTSGWTATSSPIAHGAATGGTRTYSPAAGNTATLTVGITSGAGDIYYRLTITPAAGAGNTAYQCNTISPVIKVTAIPDPVITVTNQYLCQGGAITITPTITGGAGTLTYQWQTSVDGGTFANTTNNTPAGITYPGGATSSSLSISGSGSEAVGNAYVSLPGGRKLYKLQIIVNPYGCNNAGGNNSIISFSKNTISSQPAAETVKCTSDAASFTLSAQRAALATTQGTNYNVTTAVATPYTFQWQYSADNSAWSDVVNGTPAGINYTNGTTTSSATTAVTSTLTLSRSGGTWPAGTYYYRMKVITPASVTVTQVHSSNATTCEVFTNTSTVIVTDPLVSPTVLPKLPNNNVCEGQTLSVSTPTGGSGGFSCNYEYRYNDGSGWTAWSTTVPSFAAVAGTNTVEARRSCAKSCNGNNPSTSVSTSWTVYPQPVSPSISGTKSPNVASICQGQTASVNITAGSGGGTDAFDVVQVSTDGGGTWSNYVSGNPINTSSATGSVQVRGYRDGGTTSSGCNVSTPVTIATWTIIPQIVAPTLASKLPNATAVCQGQDVAAIITPGSGGAGAADNYYYRIDGGAPVAYNSGDVITTGSVNNYVVVYATRSAGTGLGCTATLDTLASWHVYPSPVAATLNTRYPAASLICTGQKVLATITAGSGGAPDAVDIYEYSIDSGSTWTTYNSGDSIATASASGRVIIRVRRTTGSATGCTPTGNIEITAWDVTSTPTSTKLSPAINFCDGSAVLELTNVTPSSASVTWELASGPGSPTAGPVTENPTTVTGLEAGTTKYYVTVAMGASCTVLDSVSVVYTSYNDWISRLDYCTSCVITDGTTSIFYDSQGKIFAKVEDITGDSGSELGLTEVCFDFIPPVPATPFQPHVADDQGDWQPYLNRRFTVNPATSSGAIVTLYMYQTEYDSLRWRVDNHFDLDTRVKYKINSTADLRVTKYPGGSGGSFIPPASPSGELIVPSAVNTITGGNGGTVYEVVLPTINSFSTFYIHPKSKYPAAPLPIELVSLTATGLSSSIMVQWQTASEINNQQFDVERSTDGLNFIKIGEVAGNGTTNIPHYYSLEDKNVQAGVKYYYRLKQIDFNSSSEYSNIVWASISPALSFDLGEFVPNPTRTKSSITVTTIREETLQYTMYNVAGIEVMSKTLKAPKGLTTFEFDFSGLTAGSYVGQFNTPDGRMVRKLVKID